MRWGRPQWGAGAHRLFWRIANPWNVLTYNPYDVDGSGSSGAKSLSSRLLLCQYATLQKSGEEA
jgi:hypothetical protein